MIFTKILQNIAEDLEKTFDPSNDEINSPLPKRKN